MGRDKPSAWRDGEPPRSRDDLVTLIRAAMSRRIPYLDAGELTALAEGVLDSFKRHSLRLSLRRPWARPTPRADAGGTLADWRWPTVEVACATCGRQGVYHREKMIARLGPDVRLPDLASKIAAGCASDACGVHLPQLNAAIAGYRNRRGQSHRR